MCECVVCEWVEAFNWNSIFVVAVAGVVVLNISKSQATSFDCLSSQSLIDSWFC